MSDGWTESGPGTEGAAGTASDAGTGTAAGAPDAAPPPTTEGRAGMAAPPAPPTRAGTGAAPAPAPRRRDDRGRSDRGTLVLGALLVLVGIAFLVSNQLSVDLGHYGWPLWVIGPGVALLLLGFVIGGEGGLGAAIPGGIVTAVGLLLAFQNVTGAWASWAYAWALIAPGSVGVTLALYGLVHGRWDLLDSGLRTAAVGLGLFIGFGIFFEYGLNISQGEAEGMKTALPALAVVAGVLIVVASLLPHPRHEEQGAGSPNSNRPNV